MSLIKIDPKLCINCGICSNVCPIRVLSMDENGPVAARPDECISCGHCVAVCPYAALDNINTPLSKQETIAKLPILDAKTAEQFLRSRRSIRCYKNSKVPRDQLLQLVNIARFAPTGSNRQGVSYIIVEDKDIIKTATRLVIEWIEGQGDKPVHWSLPVHARTYRETATDPILRDAPHLILGITDKNIARGRENTTLSFSYLELFAPSLGLGSCWAGLLELAIFADYQPLLDLFKFPEDKKFTGAIMVGYPKYTYKRLVDRNPLDVNCDGYWI